jgi:hypothetical protein
MARDACGLIVDNMLMKFPLRQGNDPLTRWFGLSEQAFLPTMRLQPSQLPKIVGSGRVA